MPGIVSTKLCASVRDNASPPLKTCRRDVTVWSSSVSINAWSSVGTHCNVVTSCSRMVSMSISGSR